MTATAPRTKPIVHNWRDCKAWNDFGTPLSTASNESSKLFDAILTQYVGWYDEDTLGGLEGSIVKLVESDPNFVMGHVLKNGLDLMGTGRTVNNDEEFKKDINAMMELANKEKLTDRERKHVNAVHLFSQGDMTKACQVWEDILCEHPLDMLALKYAHDSYFYLGYQPQMRDSVARVFPHWKPSMPLYGYLYGMHSFGLVETNMYDQAEKVALKGLDINPNDAWSTHSMAHVLEMGGRQKEGIDFLKGTENNWNICGMLSCHNYWHYALCQIEVKNYEEAFGVFDTKVKEMSTTSGAMLDLVDACSLLFRLEMEGQNVKDRWDAIAEVCRPHMDDHILAFNDVHMLMSFLGKKDNELAEQFMTSLKNFVNNGKGDNQIICKEVGVALCEAFVLYDQGKFDEALELLYPIRYKILRIGGSNAQRDLFNQFLINTALKSQKKENQKRARFMLTERKALKESSPLTDRLIAKSMALHCD